MKSFLKTFFTHKYTHKITFIYSQKIEVNHQINSNEKMKKISRIHFISQRLFIPPPTLNKTILSALIAIFFLTLISISAPIPKTYKNSRIKIGKQVWALYSGNYASYNHDKFWKTWNFHISNINQSFSFPYSALDQSIYPSLGPYSSHDISVIRMHLNWAYQSGIDSFIVQWYGEQSTNRSYQHKADGFSDYTLQLLLSYAPEFHITIIPFIMDYEIERSNQTFYDDAVYLWKKYASNSTILHLFNKPVFGIKNPNSIKGSFYAFKNLHESGINPFWISNYDGPFDVGTAVENGISGLMTFNPSDGSTFASNSSQWKNYGTDFKQRSLLFIPTVSPGCDKKPSSSNYLLSFQTHERENGTYYDNMWKAALKVKTDAVAISSFNFWDEGSNIEPSIDREKYHLTKETWSNNKDPLFYLKKTKYWINKFKGFIE